MLLVVPGDGWCGCCEGIYSGGWTDVVGHVASASGISKRASFVRSRGTKLPCLRRSVGSPSNPRASDETIARRLRSCHRRFEQSGRGRIGWFVRLPRSELRRWVGRSGRDVALGSGVPSRAPFVCCVAKNCRACVHAWALCGILEALASRWLGCWGLVIGRLELSGEVELRGWLDRCCWDVSSGSGIPKRASFVRVRGTKLPCWRRCVGSLRNPCGLMVARRQRPGRRRPRREGCGHALPERPSEVPLAFSSPRNLSRLAVRARSPLWCFHSRPFGLCGSLVGIDAACTRRRMRGRWPVCVGRLRAGAPNCRPAVPPSYSAHVPVGPCGEV